MKINIQNLPEEGKQLEGELDSSILVEGARLEKYPEPIHYDLHADNSSGGLLVTGSIYTQAELRCARCDTPFSFELRSDEFTHFDDEVKGDEVDLTEPIREELLLKLPDYPHCDVEGGMVCPGHELLAKNHEQARIEPEEGGQDSRWGGLDQFKVE